MNDYREFPGLQHFIVDRIDDTLQGSSWLSLDSVLWLLILWNLSFFPFLSFPRVSLCYSNCLMLSIVTGRISFIKMICSMEEKQNKKRNNWKTHGWVEWWKRVIL